MGAIREFTPGNIEGPESFKKWRIDIYHNDLITSPLTVEMIAVRSQLEDLCNMFVRNGISIVTEEIKPDGQ